MTVVVQIISYLSHLMKTILINRFVMLFKNDYLVVDVKYYLRSTLLSYSLQNKCQTADPDQQNLGRSGKLSCFTIYEFWQTCGSVRQISDLILKTGVIGHMCVFHLELKMKSIHTENHVNWTYLKNVKCVKWLPDKLLGGNIYCSECCQPEQYPR